jgi:hypothetical protein
MTFQQELASWKAPLAIETAPVPSVGSKASTSPKLRIPPPSGKPTIITFLRHCGCSCGPSVHLLFEANFDIVAEKTFKQLTQLSSENPQVSFVAVSHSDQEATDRWVVLVGGEWNVNVIVDAERKLYAQWGLGVSSTWHVLNPWSIYKSYRMAKDEKIWNKPTESGSRWQIAGSFAVGGDGVVRWVHVAKSADDMPDFKEALMTLNVEEPKAIPDKGL